MYIFFFFKQKTAYEMRISDGSSDVCSSDLDVEDKRNHEHGDRTPTRRATKPKPGVTGLCEMANSVEANTVRAIQNGCAFLLANPFSRVGNGNPRSEEHTAELQPLMRISYAVFCLKKTKPANRTAIEGAGTDSKT